MTAPGRFPLRPGRPLVYRRDNGAWGYTCNCLHHGHLHALRTDRYNCADWAQSWREALVHIEVYHKSRAELETEHLERLYALPTAERSNP